MTRQAVFTVNAPKSKHPLSQAVIHNGLIFLSGQGPLDPSSGRVIGGSIEAQTRRTLDNVSAVLAAAGSSLENVLSVTCYLRNTEDVSRFNEAYLAYFSEPLPARSAFIVSDLLADIDIELVVVAASGTSQSVERKA